MEIIVHQAILHVLDTTLDAPVLSGSCMEMTAEKTGLSIKKLTFICVCFMFVNYFSVLAESGV